MVQLSAPQGCSMAWPNMALCDYNRWRPPLNDQDFNDEPGYISLHNVNGVLPSNAFSGLNGPTNAYQNTRVLSIECGINTNNVLFLPSNTLTSNLAWLEEISIKDCTNMQIADMAFSALTGITVLSIISGNFLDISTTALYGLKQLTTLNINAAFPKSGIPVGLFDGLTGLTDLDMSTALIHSIPLGIFDGLKNLKTLDMSECGLTTLPNNVFLSLLSLTTLDVSTNNFHCDCNLQWLGQYLQDTGLQKSTCTTPTSLNTYDLTRSLQNLMCTEEEKPSDDDDWRLILAVTLGCLGMAVAVVALAIVYCQHRKLNRLLGKRNQAGKHTTGVPDIITRTVLPTTTRVSEIKPSSQRMSRVEVEMPARSVAKVTPIEDGPIIMKPHYFPGKPMYVDQI